MKTRFAKPAIAALAAIALVFAGSTPASAASGNYSCPNIGHSYSISVSRTAATALSGCGLTVQVRIKYTLPIGVTAYTGWTSGITNVTVTPPAGGTVVLGDFRIGTLAHNNVKP